MLAFRKVIRCLWLLSAKLKYRKFVRESLLFVLPDTSAPIRFVSRPLVIETVFAAVIWVFSFVALWPFALPFAPLAARSIVKPFCVPPRLAPTPMLALVLLLLLEFCVVFCALCR